MTKRQLDRADRREGPKRRRQSPAMRMHADKLPSPKKISEVEREGKRRLFGTMVQGTLRRFQEEEKDVRDVEQIQAAKQKEIERRLQRDRLPTQTERLDALRLKRGKLQVIEPKRGAWKRECERDKLQAIEWGGEREPREKLRAIEPRREPDDRHLERDKPPTIQEKLDAIRQKREEDELSRERLIEKSRQPRPFSHSQQPVETATAPHIVYVPTVPNDVRPPPPQQKPAAPQQKPAQQHFYRTQTEPHLYFKPAASDDEKTGQLRLQKQQQKFLRTETEPHLYFMSAAPDDAKPAAPKQQQQVTLPQTTAPDDAKPAAPKQLQQILHTKTAPHLSYKPTVPIPVTVD